ALQARLVDNGDYQIGGLRGESGEGCENQRIYLRGGALYIAGGVTGSEARRCGIGAVHYQGHETSSSARTDSSVAAVTAGARKHVGQTSSRTLRTSTLV